MLTQRQLSALQENKMDASDVTDAFRRKSFKGHAGTPWGSEATVD